MPLFQGLKYLQEITSIKGLISLRELTYLFIIIVTMSGLDLLHVASIAVMLGHLLSNDANSNNVLLDVSNHFPNLSYSEFLLIGFVAIGLLKVGLGSVLMFKQNSFLSYKKLELRQKLVNVLFSKKYLYDNHLKCTL